MPGQAIINKDAETKPIGKGQFQNTGLSKEHTIKRGQALMAEYSTWQATDKEISTYVYPTKGFFDQATPNSGSKIDHKTLIDEEGTLCADAFGAGMTSGFTSPTRPWFEIFLDDDMLMEVPRVKWWIDEVRTIMLDIFQRSNTYIVLTSMYIELSVFSRACAYIEEDYKNVIHIRNFTAGEYYLSRDSKGRVNGFYHRFNMTTGQMVKDFGIENCSLTVQGEYQNNRPDNWHIINHLIEDNDNRIPFLADYKNMPYRSIYWEEGTLEESYLRIGGYEELPILAPRWDETTTADAYGKAGPGWKALGSIKELQKKVKDELIGIDKESNPPLQKDGSVIGDVNTLPGGITTTSALVPNVGVRPTYQVQLNLANLDASIEKTKAKIRRFFYVDLFLMMIQAEREGRQITATEIMEKQSEKVSMLGPLLERWQGDDFIKALIERTFNIGLRNGAFPEPPPELQDRELKICYTSILAQAQKMQDSFAIDQWVTSVLAVASASPDISDNINFDEYALQKGKMLGIPSRLINSPQAKAAMRKARQKLAAEADAQNKMMISVEAAKKGAGAVKDMAAAPLGTNSALDSTLEAIKGAQPK